jgi:hypothetical protein
MLNVTVTAETLDLVMSCAVDLVKLRRIDTAVIVETVAGKTDAAIYLAIDLDLPLMAGLAATGLVRYEF